MKSLRETIWSASGVDPAIVSQRTAEGRCLIIAEIAQAHDGSLGTAHAYIDAVSRAGADAVKFQTHLAAAESTPAEPWRVKFSSQDRTRFEYWQRMEFSEEAWQGLKRHATEAGLLFLSSPFSIEAVELLNRVGVAAWKVASGELTNVPLLQKMAESQRPMIISTGMNSWTEVDAAVGLVQSHNLPMAVLQCTSDYPCGPEHVGLNMLQEYRSRYHIPVGLSDHSGTVFPGLAAVALGAEVLEVHVTMSRELFGPDVRASVTTQELRLLVDGTRFIEQTLRHPVDKDAMCQDLSHIRKMFTKSIVAKRDLAEGTVLSSDDLAVKKPGTGLPAARLPEVVGRRLRRRVSVDTMICEDDLE